MDGLGIMQPKTGERHIWMIVNKDGDFYWQCVECDEHCKEDLPPSHGCKPKEKP
jgi:hypothetical protein